MKNIKLNYTENKVKRLIIQGYNRIQNNRMKVFFEINKIFRLMNGSILENERFYINFKYRNKQ